MNTIYYWGLLTAALLLLSGCEATQQATPSLSTEIAISDPNIDGAGSHLNIENSAQAKIQAFRDADFVSVISPYFQRLQKIDVLTEEQVCLPENMALYDELIKLNSSSLYIKSVKLGCRMDSISDEEYFQEMEEISKIAAVLVKNGTGESVDNAVQVREIAELNLILEMAGLSVLDMEVVYNNDLMYFKLHCWDSVTNQFSYRYGSNYTFFSNIFTNSTGRYFSPSNASMFLAKTLSEGKSPAVTPFVLRNLAYKREHQSIINIAPEITGSALSEILIAQAALMLEDDETLNLYLDNIVQYADSGLISANSFIAQFLFIKDAQNSWDDINAELHKIDVVTETGYGLRKFLEDLTLRSDYQLQLKKFLTLSDPSVIDQIYDFSEYLKEYNTRSTYDLESLIDETMSVLAEFQHPIAQHRAAKHFFALETKTPEQLRRAKELLEASANSGYDEALLSLGLKFGLAEDGYEGNRQKAYDYYMKAAMQGNRYAWHNVAAYQRDGLLGDVDLALAIEYFQNAIDANYLLGYCNIGEIYRTKIKPANFLKAKEHYFNGISKLTDDDDAKECNEGLGMLYKFEDKDYVEAIKTFKKAAASGSGFAAYQLAKMYDFDSFNMQNITKAVEYYELAIELNYHNAAANLGFMYESGKGDIDPDNEKAVHYYQLGEKVEHPQAMNNLATFYLHGIAIEKDVATALQLYKKAADLGNDFAAENYGDILWEGEHIISNFIQACDYYQIAYEKQFLDAYFDLAYCFSEGIGRYPDIEKATQILREGIAQGDEELIYELGVQLAINEQYEEAESLLKQAISLGYQEGYIELAALYNKQKKYVLAYATYEEALAANIEVDVDIEEQLAFMLWLGRGTDEDKPTAIAQLTEIAKNKFKNPNTYLGDKFTFGYIGEPNYQLAFQYYSKTGNSDARVLNNLGEMYREGQFVNKDIEKAVEYYQIASEMGNRAAYHNLGEFYRDGIFFNKDTFKASEMYLKAAEKGFVSAMLELSKLYLSGVIPAPKEKDAEFWLRKAQGDSDEALLLLSDVMLARENPEEYAEGIYLLNIALQAQVEDANELVVKHQIKKEELRHD